MELWISMYDICCETVVTVIFVEVDCMTVRNVCQMLLSVLSCAVAASIMFWSSALWSIGRFHTNRKRRRPTFRRTQSSQVWTNNCFLFICKEILCLYILYICQFFKSIHLCNKYTVIAGLGKLGFRMWSVLTRHWRNIPLKDSLHWCYL